MSEAVLAVSGVVFAAFCVWLAVRIINRRERWAIAVVLAFTTLAVAAGLGLFVTHLFRTFMRGRGEESRLLASASQMSWRKVGWHALPEVTKEGRGERPVARLAFRALLAPKSRI